MKLKYFRLPTSLNVKETEQKLPELLNQIKEIPPELKKHDISKLFDKDNPIKLKFIDDNKEDKEYTFEQLCTTFIVKIKHDKSEKMQTGARSIEQQGFDEPILIEFCDAMASAHLNLTKAYEDLYNLLKVTFNIQYVQSFHILIFSIYAAKIRLKVNGIEKQLYQYINEKYYIFPFDEVQYVPTLSGFDVLFRQYIKFYHTSDHLFQVQEVRKGQMTQLTNALTIMYSELNSEDKIKILNEMYANMLVYDLE